VLVDRYGRVATDLRVSLTDRCNLRCAYCMPAEGLAWLPSPDVLTDDEVLRLVRIAVERLGVRQIRFTGGEPLLRKGLVDIVRGSARLQPRPELSLTTNGIGLARLAQSLADAGLDRVNGSLDTLDPQRFEAISRRRRLPDVLDGLAAAAAAGLTPVKINAVLLRGINDRAVPDFLRLAWEKPIQVRFIEYMPIGAPGATQNGRFLSANYILETAALLGMELSPEEQPAGNGPAVVYTLRGGKGRIGLIHPISRRVCAGCSRLRLTADGFLKPCLYWQDELPVRPVLERPDELRRLFRRAVRMKRREHSLGAADPGLARMRCMSRIGG